MDTPTLASCSPEELDVVIGGLSGLERAFNVQYVYALSPFAQYIQPAMTFWQNYWRRMGVPIPRHL